MHKGTEAISLTPAETGASVPPPPPYQGKPKLNRGKPKLKMIEGGKSETLGDIEEALAGLHAADQRKKAAGEGPEVTLDEMVEVEIPAEQEEIKAVPAPMSEELKQAIKLDKQDRARLKEIVRDVKQQYGLSDDDLESGAWQTAVAKTAGFGARFMGSLRGLVGQPRDPNLVALVDEYEGLKVAVEARQVSLSELKKAQEKYEREKRPLGIVLRGGGSTYSGGGLGNIESATARREFRYESPAKTLTPEEQAQIPNLVIERVPALEAKPIPLVRKKEKAKKGPTQQEYLTKKVEGLRQAKVENEYRKTAEYLNLWEQLEKEAAARKITLLDRSGRIRVGLGRDVLPKLMDLHEELVESSKNLGKEPPEELRPEIAKLVDERERTQAQAA